jgi:hypothetical protein
MTYKEQRELVEGLRALADEMEKNGVKLPISSPDVTFVNWVYDDHRGEKKRTAKEKLAAAARLLGKTEKVYSGDYFDLNKKYGPVILQFTATRANICRRVVVSTKVIPAKVIEQPERIQEEVEWVCDEPLLMPPAN